MTGITTALLLVSGDGMSPLTWMLWALAAFATGYVVFHFVRSSEGHPAVSVVAAILGHIALLGLLSVDYAPYGCAERPKPSDRIEFEVAVLEPEPEPEPPKPEPEPEPEPPEPEPEPEPEPKPPPKELPKDPPKKAKSPEPPKADTPPQEAAPAKPMRFDMTNTTSGGSSGVSVETGEPGGVPGGEPGGTSKKAGGKGTAPAEQASGTGTPWEPRSDIFIKDLPDPVSVPKLTCPATRDQGISGTVVLKVQVQRDGKVRKVTVAKGIGGGCDQIAAKALRQARFKAAMGTNGKPVDYELRYEYEFRLSE